LAQKEGGFMFWGVIKFINKHSLTLCSLIIALCGLLLTIFQGSETRQYNRLSTKPFVDIELSLESDGLGYFVKSGGLGPAIVKWIDVKVDGVSQEDWNSVALKLGLKGYFIQSWAPLEGSSFAPGTRTLMYKMLEGSTKELPKLNLNRLQINLCYCSVYGNCWLAIIDDDLASKACGNPPKQRFKGNFEVLGHTSTYVVSERPKM
jgi:hypothetical protein